MPWNAACTDSASTAVPPLGQVGQREWCSALKAQGSLKGREEYWTSWEAGRFWFQTCNLSTGLEVLDWTSPGQVPGSAAGGEQALGRQQLLLSPVLSSSSFSGLYLASLAYARNTTMADSKRAAMNSRTVLPRILFTWLLVPFTAPLSCSPQNKGQSQQSCGWQGASTVHACPGLRKEGD